MSESKFKTMRHIEAVRNHLDTCIDILKHRAQNHDQTKLESPEVEVFEEYTPKLRNCTYGSDEYKQNMREMKVAIDHHNKFNSHHPEHHENGINGMDMFDLIEMIVDWKCSGMRHDDGDIIRSVEINQGRFGYTDEIKNLLLRTIGHIDSKQTFHNANES